MMARATPRTAKNGCATEEPAVGDAGVRPLQGRSRPEVQFVAANCTLLVWRTEVGREPLAAGAAIVDHIERVEQAEDAAILTESIDGSADRFQTCREITCAHEVSDDARPESSKRFVVAAGFGVRGANRFVVTDDAGSGQVQRRIRGVFIGEASRDCYVSGVGPQ